MYLYSLWIEFTQIIVENASTVVLYPLEMLILCVSSVFYVFWHHFTFHKIFSQATALYQWNILIQSLALFILKKI